MFDVGWSELLLIGVVALIVIGPEDLPKLFHTMGRITARARSMAREFTSAMEDAAKSSGLDEAAKSLKEVNSLTSKRSLGLDALERATERFEKWDPLNPREEAKRDAPVPDPSAPVPPQAAAPGITAPVEDPGDTAGGKRRLHAVRRSDRES
ncbi:Sec-independent protein translocase protein TatB [Paracoccus yeei]|uniref:Sec-independent protein translocase protein TatB n=1 Tax=Paracoccus yeei TaxID=147645 RepID=A0A386ULN7_9RHOB|nr:Sec-independent protein translocase protein TatB [Paracoccus yeei]AYF01198.1 twin-arginine translocation protein TatB [Paracoccus yeei]MBY0136850.1 twin-arginine translocase subunit TatB [Paracoccus yeei]